MTIDYGTSATPTRCHTRWSCASTRSAGWTLRTR